MNQKRKAAVLVLVASALMAPYLWFAIHFSAQYPSGHWPTWLAYSIPIWFTANFLILVLIIKGLSRGQVVDAAKARVAAEKSVSHSKRLVIFWSLFFLYGVKETLQGKIPLNRAIPAGAFLLLFIGIFTWVIYQRKTWKSLKQNPFTTFNPSAI